MHGWLYLLAGSSPALLDTFNRLKDEMPWLIALCTIVVTAIMTPGFHSWCTDALARVVSCVLMERTVVISSSSSVQSTSKSHQNNGDKSQRALLDSVLRYVVECFPDHASHVGLCASFKQRTRKDGEEFMILEYIKVFAGGRAVYLKKVKIYLKLEEKIVAAAAGCGNSNNNPYGSSSNNNATVMHQVATLTAYGPGATRRLDEFVKTCVGSYNEEKCTNNTGMSFVWKPCFLPDDDRVGFRKFRQGNNRGACATKFKCKIRDKVRLHLRAMKEKRRDTLGMLLHGPPGTGKTSFVRWLAEETGRDVICLKLSMFTKHPHLLEDLLLRGVFYTEDQGNVTVPIENVIFLIDECDDDKNNCLVTKREDVPRKSNGKNWQSPKFESAAEQAKHDMMEAREMTLPTLLEIVDGLVVVPDRIIVMTTNRPHILDDALLRPGRMGDFNICLPFVCAEQANELISAHFQRPLDDAQASRLNEICSSRNITLAVIYSRLSHCVSVDEILDVLSLDDRTPIDRTSS